MLQKTAAQRAIACPHWRWLEGMRWTAPIRPGGYGPEGVCGRIERYGDQPFDACALPDFGDPLTAAGLLPLVRIAHDDARLAVVPRGERLWAVMGPPWQKRASIALAANEVDALVMALELAP